MGNGQLVSRDGNCVDQFRERQLRDGASAKRPPPACRLHLQASRERGEEGLMSAGPLHGGWQTDAASSRRRMTTSAVFKMGAASALAPVIGPSLPVGDAYCPRRKCLRLRKWR